MLKCLCFSSGGEACGRHSAGNGHSVRAGEKRGEDVPSDAVQPLSEDQRQTRGHQQCAGATSEVGCVYYAIKAVYSTSQ